LQINVFNIYANGRGEKREKRKKGYSLKSPHFTLIGSFIMKTVTDKRRHAAYHNKHSWRAFKGYQHR